MSHHGVRWQTGPILHRMQVGAANPASMDLQNDFSGTRRGLGYIDHCHLILLLEYRGFHEVSSPSCAIENRDTYGLSARSALLDQFDLVSVGVFYECDHRASVFHRTGFADDLHALFR